MSIRKWRNILNQKRRDRRNAASGDRRFCPVCGQRGRIDARRGLWYYPCCDIAEYAVKTAKEVWDHSASTGAEMAPVNALWSLCRDHNLNDEDIILVANSMSSTDAGFMVR